MRNVVAFLALTVALSSPAAAQRLSDAVIPEHYTLWFAPDLAKATFRGRETIRAVVTQRSNSITLHAAEIEFGEVKITSGGRTQVARVTTHPQAETATLTVPQALSEGPVTIEVTYNGILNDKLRGFYLSESNGKKYAVSQMEATDARRAFPSFDEPALKATFDISLMVDRGNVAISNGKVVSDTAGPEPGKHTVTFARTPKMSTYLVALLVGDFACREGSSEGIPIRICSTPDKRDLTGFALDAAASDLKFYNEYFGLKYPFGKLDIIGIPDFAAGAMENAGAITFRERMLLADPKQSSISTRKTVANVIAHEIAHQWFGDLVTMKWWNDVWLNEGFATWVESKAVAAWKPDWQVDIDVALDTQRALAIDTAATTRPVRTKVETPEEINEVFDSIAYEKAAAVLRMVESYVGAEPFRKGVASYIARYAYKNAAGEDFWTEMARVTGRPIDRMIRSFVDQEGAPLLTIRQSCGGKSSQVAIAQSRLLAIPEKSSQPQTWTLPACLRSSDDKPRCEVVEKPTQTVEVNGCDPVFVNADGHGYYVSDYTPEAIRALTKRPSLSRVERLTLATDEWWMTLSARHDIGVFLDLVNDFAADDTPAILNALQTRVSYIASNVVDENPRLQFQKWIHDRFGPILMQLGISGDPRDPDYLQGRRATLMALIGVDGGDATVQRGARELATQYMASPAAISATLAPTVLQIAAFRGDRTLYDQYVAKLPTLTSQPEEYYTYFNALAWFADPALLQQTLKWSLSPAVRSQDTGTLLRNMLQLPWAREATWKFVRDQWPELIEKLGLFQGIPGVVSGLSNLCTAADAADVRAFFAKHPEEAVARRIEQSIESIETCASVSAHQSRPLASWLETQRSP